MRQEPRVKREKKNVVENKGKEKKKKMRKFFGGLVSR